MRIANLQRAGWGVSPFLGCYVDAALVEAFGELVGDEAAANRERVEGVGGATVAVKVSDRC